MRVVKKAETRLKLAGDKEKEGERPLFLKRPKK